MTRIALGEGATLDVARLIETDPTWKRFARDFVVAESGCWQWTGSLYAVGYGRFSTGGRWVTAHRWCYERLIGPVPPGLDLDHLCRNRPCVNPQHLDPVTRRENLLRGETIPARNSRKTHCPSGHAYTPENTRIYRSGRYCKACNRERCRIDSRDRRARERAARMVSA